MGMFSDSGTSIDKEYDYLTLQTKFYDLRHKFWEANHQISLMQSRIESLEKFVGVKYETEPRHVDHDEE